MNKQLIPLLAVLLAIPGCGKKNEDESGAKRAGNKVGETITDFASGIGKGIDKQMVVNVELSDGLKQRGITKNTAKALGMDHPNAKGITVYFGSKDPFKGKLSAKAFNKEGVEIGRSMVDVEFTADDAKYVTFTFDNEMDTQLVDKYLVDVKE